MPVLLLESGSLLFTKHECFRVGQLSSATSAGKHRSDRSVLTHDSALRGENEKAVDDGSILSAALNSISTSTTKLPPFEELYKIKLLFEKTTMFLKYPYSMFSRILDDEKLMMKSMSDGEFFRDLWYSIP